MQEIITIQTVGMKCGECGVFFWVAQEYHRERKEYGLSWYCPNGHERVYRESDANRLKRELKEAQAKLANTQFELMAAENRIGRLEKRAKNGTCPCCHRQFVQLARHMKSKLPDFAR